MPWPALNITAAHFLRILVNTQFSVSVHMSSCIPVPRCLTEEKRIPASLSFRASSEISRPFGIPWTASALRLFGKRLIPDSSAVTLNCILAENRRGQALPAFRTIRLPVPESTLDPTSHLNEIASTMYTASPVSDTPMLM